MASIACLLIRTKRAYITLSWHFSHITWISCLFGLDAITLTLSVPLSYYVKCIFLWISLGNWTQPNNDLLLINKWLVGIKLLLIFCANMCFPTKSYYLAYNEASLFYPRQGIHEFWEGMKLMSIWPKRDIYIFGIHIKIRFLWVNQV